MWFIKRTSMFASKTRSLEVFIQRASRRNKLSREKQLKSHFLSSDHDLSHDTFLRSWNPAQILAHLIWRSWYLIDMKKWWIIFDRLIPVDVDLFNLLLKKIQFTENGQDVQVRKYKCQSFSCSFIKLISEVKLKSMTMSHSHQSVDEADSFKVDDKEIRMSTFSFHISRLLFVLCCRESFYFSSFRKRLFSITQLNL